MKTLVHACSMSIAACLLAPPASAEGDPEAGHQLAIEWCSRCHDTEPGGRMKEDPPSFAAIAIYRSADQIRGKIIAPHIGMPEYGLILGLDVDDLTAYIVSLEKE
jgi:mono/diheme cytochrome c family protein